MRIGIHIHIHNQIQIKTSSKKKDHKVETRMTKNNVKISELQ